MNTDLATQLLTSRAAATQQTVQLAVLKKSHEMESDLVAMLAQAVQAAPPAGQGLTVDKRA
ncbi:MAG: hypothetical protein JWR39_1453 [Devosia sp.]|jgi:hypothetical protein|nr:hypothetical protein [Devosia sp.]